MTDGQELRAALRQTRKRWMTATMPAAAARGLGSVAGLLLGLAAFDRLSYLTDLSFLILFGVVVLLSALVMAWMVWPFRRLPGDRQVARFIEERRPELEDRITTSASELEGSQSASPFRELMFADAAARLRHVDSDEIVSSARVRRSVWQLGGAAVLLVVAVWMARDPTRRGWQALSATLFPPEIAIQVTPGDIKIVSGHPLQIQARVIGVPWLRRAPLLTSRTEQAERMLEMQRAAPNRFAIEIPSVTNGFKYRIAVGDVSSSEYTVSVLRAPRVARIDLRYEYPRSTSLSPRVEEDGGDVYAPPGTRVQLRIRSDKPVRAGAMMMSDGTRLGLTQVLDDVLEAAFKVAEDGSYRVALSDTDGLTNPGETEYFIRMMEDRPPDVRILRPAGDRQVTPLEEVTIEARADDDYGLDRLELVYGVRGRVERVVLLSGSKPAPTRTGSHTVYLEDLKVQPGDFVTYYARARDVGRTTRSTEARSDIFFLEVRPFGEEFVSAQSQSMAGSGDRSLDDLAAAQKEIIIATWKVDRRSAGGGRSEQDIKAVARAQGELKARARDAAAQLSGPGFRRRPVPQPNPVAPAEGDDPMARAAVAMGRAQSALEAIKTAEALPHEMEALSQLLKAQAEVRRRQVARQQSRGGMGGSNRASQDLSQMFDRELQRQQQTNYETPSSLEQRNQSESDALAKLRELAKRQDELSEQQRNLARQQAQMSAEELKRRLERLTRDQGELRRQAEELSRQLAQQQSGQAKTSSRSNQNGQSNGNGQSGGSQSGEGRSQGGAGQMREISEEMRSAASELRRRDPEQASARSDRASEKLRDLERQLSGTQPNERRRALGEMQLEAQQLAESQRRAAGEVRGSNGQAVAGDAARRLAAEKERLAERVDALERSMKQLSSAAAPKERQAVNAAAGELAREQVAQKMRQSAGTLRKAGESSTAGAAGIDANRLAQTEQQLARALERTAEKLGDAGSDEDAQARKLSDELARARDVRERLAELERKLDALNRPGSQSAQAAQESGRSGQSGREPNGSAGQSMSKQTSSSGRGGQGGQPASRQRSSDGRTGQGNANSQQLGELRDEYARQLRQAEELTKGRLGQSPGLGGSPEHHEYSPPAPGTEAFKQDFSRWETLGRGVKLALEQYEAALSQKLAEHEARDRLNAGVDERMPEQYRQSVAKYYQSLARKPRKELQH